VDCPLDCEYLQEARRRDRRPAPGQSEWPNQDIHLSEQFIVDHERLLTFVGHTIAAAALDTPGTVDFDVREALDGLIRTYRTLQSGVYYESIPANPLAANLYRAVQQRTAEFREAEKQRTGLSQTRDADVLGSLVFLQRMELDRNNGRPRGRAFIDELRAFYESAAREGSPAPSSLILP
jgi:hypothetical protein